jgi:hypothetical protein
MATSFGDALCVRQLGAAAELNLEVHDPCVLKESNNTVVWLRPLPVVAKVATWLAQAGGGLAHELSVLAHLEGADVPVARLARDLEPKLHVHDGLTVLLFTYIECDPTLEVHLGIARATLSAVPSASRPGDAGGATALIAVEDSGYPAEPSPESDPLAWDYARVKFEPEASETVIGSTAEPASRSAPLSRAGGAGGRRSSFVLDQGHAPVCPEHSNSLRRRRFAVRILDLAVPSGMCS